MTAQEWLEELERLRKAAAPGPWTYARKAMNDELDVYFYILNKKDKRFAYAPPITRAECCGNHKTQEDNAAYIVAACNAVPRLVEMLRIAVSIIEGQNASRRDNYGESMFGDPMQTLFTMTEPKE